MFGGAGQTEFDLRFSIGRIPIRVHPIFWLCAAIISWQGPRMDLTAIGVIVVFVSVLVHELGHAVTSRMFGYPSEIVLYFFGGYATTQRQSTWKDITTLFAGPGAGFVLFAITLFLAMMGQNGGWISGLPIIWQERIIHAVRFLLFANLVWSLLNLIPVLPLDGGQICREICLWISPRDGMRWALIIAIGTSGLLAIYGAICIRNGVGMFGVAEPRLPTLFFGLMCFQNIQLYQSQQRY